jgi:hypothetical protein
MKDGNLANLYTKETRKVLQLALYLQSIRSSRATEQQSDL